MANNKTTKQRKIKQNIRQQQSTKQQQKTRQCVSRSLSAS
eukprot:gene23967-1515_t